MLFFIHDINLGVQISLMKVLINIIFEVLNLSKDIQFLKDPVKVNKSQNEINLSMIF